MTYKAIIDGVDVSGCKHLTYKDSLNPMCGDSCICCRGKEDCYFKQLARKTQECELNKLKIAQLQEALRQYETDLSTKDCIVETCKAQYNQLKVERDSLQKSQFCVAYEKDCHKVCKQQNCIIKNGYKAEQKLKHIEKLCDRKTNKSSFCNGVENKGMQKLAIRILKIIGEVE